MQGLVDDIIVVDTGSTDDTREIARRMGARVFESPWCDDFSAARNESLRHAKEGWIFVLDADDRVVPPEREKLRALFASLDDGRVNHAAYMMRCVCLTLDGGVGSEVQQVRLFRNDPRARYRYRVHEQILPALAATGGTAAPTAIRIVHTGYRDAAAVERKVLRNLRLNELDCAERPHDPLVLFYRGALLLDLHRVEEALVSLHLCRALLDPKTDASRRLHLLLARAYREMGVETEAIEVLRAGQALFPGDVELLYLDAQLLVRSGDLAAAASRLMQIERKPDRTIHAVGARTLLGEIHLALGQSEAAEQIARDVLEGRTAYGAAWLLLADALLAQGKTVEIERVLADLEEVRGAETARAMIRAARLAREGALADALTSTPDGLDDALLSRFRGRLREGQTGAPLVACLQAPWS